MCAPCVGDSALRARCADGRMACGAWDWHGGKGGGRAPADGTNGAASNEAPARCIIAGTRAKGARGRRRTQRTMGTWRRAMAATQVYVRYMSFVALRMPHRCTGVWSTCAMRCVAHQPPCTPQSRAVDCAYSISFLILCGAAGADSDYRTTRRGAHRRDATGPGRETLDGEAWAAWGDPSRLTSLSIAHGSS